MQEILAIALQSMQNDARRLESIGINLANVQTPGYKREVAGLPRVALAPVQASFADMVDMQAAAAGTAPAGMAVQTDQRPGTVRLTGHSLDLALAGSGYFEVLTPNGTAYTRQGNFRLDARGRLVTAQGYPVMGQGGEIVLNSAQVRIDAAGNVFESHASGAQSSAVAPGAAVADAKPVAQLKIVQFASTAGLQRLGEGLLSGQGEALALADAEVQLQQGALENSNVSSMQEMVQLVQTMRHFESMQKVALGYDEMLGTAIRKLGDVG